MTVVEPMVRSTCFQQLSAIRFIGATFEWAPSVTVCGASSSDAFPEGAAGALVLDAADAFPAGAAAPVGLVTTLVVG